MKKIKRKLIDEDSHVIMMKGKGNIHMEKKGVPKDRKPKVKS